MYGGCTPSQDATPQDVTAPPPGGAAACPPPEDPLADALAAAEGEEVHLPLGFSAASIELLCELPTRRADAGWHRRNEESLRRHVLEPLAALLSAVREKFIRVLCPEVAAARRQAASLKKGGYGRGGFHDAASFAFYDPAAPSKARSPQLYCRLDGARKVLEYGLSLGATCDEHLDRLRKAVRDAPDAVAAYLATAPEGTKVSRQTKDHCRRWTAAEWCGLVRCDPGVALGSGLAVTQWSVHVTRPLADVPALDAAGRLADDVGGLLAWAWPFFEASRTGAWPAGVAGGAAEAARRRVEGEGEADVDDHAPRTLEELAGRTSLPIELLRDMEDALLAQHQIVLTGPPGTSKTFVARQFARYFARQHASADGTVRPQGVAHTLYMHAGWSYEDFFEGLRPVDQAGRLAFENKPGVFLKWVDEALRYRHPASRHALVLDELNRCDTAAVLGELLQLLEYRGVTVPLLSGRPFVFPANLYLIGTMNAADRSVGRIDLALRRRFFWINLHPQPEVLARWLARPGNNPAGFDAGALRRVNELLAERGVAPEQQVGHALFMGGGAADEEATHASGVDADADCPPDFPLTQKRLRQVVQFSVLPYVRELLRDLMLAASARAGDDLLARIEAILLEGVSKRKTAQP